MFNENNHQQMLRGPPGYQQVTLSVSPRGYLHYSLKSGWGPMLQWLTVSFTMGHNIYAWFLLISTGIQQRYNTMQEEEHSFALILKFLGLYD